MEIFKFFAVCFLTVACKFGATAAAADLEKLREDEMPKSADAVLGVLQALNGSKDFFQSLRDGYDHEKIGLNAPSDFTPLTDAYIALEGMSSMFLFRASVYLAQIMREYFQLACDLIADDSGKFKNVRVEQKLEALRFPREHCVYCVLTAFYDWGTLRRDKYGADLLFDSLVFVRTVYARANSLGVLKSQLRSYANRYDGFLNAKRAERLQAHYAQTDGGFDAYRIALRAMAKTVGDFSRAFCSSGWTSYIRPPDLLRTTATAADTLQHDFHTRNHFVRRTFQLEVCEINIEKRPTANDDPIRIEIQQNQIFSLNCDMILAPPKEEKPVLTKKESGLKGSLFGMIRRQPSETSSIAAAENPKLFSLDSLKRWLRSNAYYVNAVMYYNVVANVLLLVSVREGDRLLKGIKKMVQKTADSGPDELSVEIIRKMKSALTVFKTVFDRLVSVVRIRRRIDVAWNKHRIAFNTRAQKTIALLDVGNGDDTMTDKDRCDRVRAEMPKTLRMIKIDDDDDHVRTIDHPLKFKSFHFSEPIHNIRQLYAYVVNGF